MKAILCSETSVNFYQIAELIRWGKRCGCGMESSPSTNITKNWGLLYVERATNGAHIEIL